MVIKVNKKDLSKKSNATIFAYCRKLIKEGVDPSESLEVYGPSLEDETKEILHFRVNVGNGASLTVNEETSDGRPRFAKYKPFPSNKRGVGTLRSDRTEEFHTSELPT